MKVKKYFAAAAACAVAAFSAAMPVNAAFTEASGNAPAESTMPQLQAPAPTSGSVPSVSFNGQTVTAASGAVLGNSTQADSASTGDTGVMLAVAGLFVTTAVGAAAVALKNRKK